MTDGLGLLGLLLLAFSGGGDKAPAAKPSGVPVGPPPPWPAALPPELPRFPGAGWEYDEPPPPAVQERARQLVPVLWKRGKGSHQTEQTAGRWITYRAEIVRSGNQGIVAYRLATSSAAPAARAPAPSSPSSPRPSSPLPPVSSRSPGVPQARPPAAAPAVPVSFPAAPSPSSLLLPVLRYGRGLRPAAPDKDVRILQQKLGLQGADVDGRFGNGTLALVKAFQGTQAINKLGWTQADVDGVVGPKTWTALFASPWTKA